MPRARKHIVCLSDTPYYHVYSRCVRRAFLCGHDKHSGKSYEHRRSWIEDRIRVLSSLFSIDICAYAVMSNHYHLVVRLNPEETNTWTDDEVLNRWTSLFRGPLLVQRCRAGDCLSPPELETLRSIVTVYRARLGSLSWFMKCLNEPIARMANAEDGCTGHFWEARFQSQPLCSDRAVLAAMAYVDLNPVRAKIAQTLEESEYTSIKARLEVDGDGDGVNHALRGAVARMLRRGEIHHFEASIRPLMRFTDQTVDAESQTNPLFIRKSEYFKLVDTSGRVISKGKQGQIDPTLVPILERLGMSGADWSQASCAFRQHYRKGDLRIRQIA